MGSRFVLFCVVLASAVAAGSTTVSIATPSVVATALCSASNDDRPVSSAQLLPIGNYRGPITSRDAQAQRFFEQGLVLGWGFDFAEALRSFRAATRIDSDCAWCYWGVAWALGPSINHDMQESDRQFALDALAQAHVRAASGSRERELIDAMALRYAAKSGADAAYARAMLALSERYPRDADLAVLAAEAQMNAHPYDYWLSKGAPKAWTAKIVATLERAINLAPDHPGAHHYWIHLFEDSKQPQRALPSADKISTLAPIVGHLVHMPSHVTFRLGRYDEAMQANVSAVKADREYRALTGAGADYALHNLHFLWAAALWAGDEDAAVRAADDLAAAAASNDVSGTRQHFLAAPMLTRVRFARWHALTPMSTDATQPYLSGLTHFVHGMTAATRGDVAAARAELASLERSRRATQAAGLRVKNTHAAADLLNVAQLQLTSALHNASGSRRRAIASARSAVAAEDQLQRDDPPVWVIPSRHLLGAALLQDAAWSEAAAVYRADLRQYRNNSIALAGLAAAERRSHRPVTQLHSSARQLALSE